MPSLKLRHSCNEQKEYSAVYSNELGSNLCLCPQNLVLLGKLFDMQPTSLVVSGS